MKPSSTQSPTTSSKYGDVHMAQCAKLVADDDVSFNADNLFNYMDARLQARIRRHYPEVPPYTEQDELENRVFNSGLTDWKLAAKYLELTDAPLSQWCMVFGRGMGRYLQWLLVERREQFDMPIISTWGDE